MRQSSNDASRPRIQTASLAPSVKPRATWCRHAQTVMRSTKVSARCASKATIWKMTSSCQTCYKLAKHSVPTLSSGCTNGPGTPFARHSTMRPSASMKPSDSPEVVRLASRYFQLMTDGRYTRVIAPLGESRLEVEQERGDRLPPSALSRGTGEQLYLAMRLALAKVYGNQAVPLPLVADDILVNFDDDRASATAALLSLYASEGHQILAFTCHRHLVRTFETNAPDAHIRALPAHA